MSAVPAVSTGDGAGGAGPRECCSRADCHAEADMIDRTEPGWYENLSGLVLRTIGRSSDCVRLGFERGFDSGEMMDAIYADRPSGRWLIGPWVDRIYLDQPGCRGLRARKALLGSTLGTLIAEQRAAGRRPVIVDV